MNDKDILEALSIIAKFAEISPNDLIGSFFKKPRLLQIYPDPKTFDFAERDKYEKEYVFSLSEKIAILFYGDKFYDYNDFPEISAERIEFWFALLDRRNKKSWNERLEKLEKYLDQTNIYEERLKIIEQWNTERQKFIAQQDDASIIQSFHPEIRIYLQFLLTRNFDLLDTYIKSNGRFGNYLFRNFQDPQDVLIDSINQYILFSEVEEYFEYHHPKSPPAISMCNPIRTCRDYSAVGRKTFFVSQEMINESLNQNLKPLPPLNYKSKQSFILCKKENFPHNIAKYLPSKMEFSPRNWIAELKKILNERNLTPEKQEKITKILSYHLEKLGTEQEVDLYCFQSPYSIFEEKYEK